MAAARRHLRVLEDEGTRFGTGMSPDQGIFHAGWTLQLAVDVAAASGSSGDIDLVRRWAAAVVAGLSASASTVAVAAARRVGDRALASDLEREAELFGLGLTLDGRRRYALGQVPVGDAFLAWARGLIAGTVWWRLRQTHR